MEQCFALKRNNKGRLSCQATTTNICSGMDTACPFYCTMANLLIGREEALKRIATLPEYIQEKIAKQYYKGEKPWGKYAEEYTGTGGNEAFGAEFEGT